jgi:hypothetical protein
MAHSKSVIALVLISLVCMATADNHQQKYDKPSKKCTLHYQVCCKEVSQCGYDKKKIRVPKECSSKECKYVDEPYQENKCEPKYKQVKVCHSQQVDNAGDSSYASAKFSVSVRSDYSQQQECTYESKPDGQNCHQVTKYNKKQVCEDKKVDCSYDSYKDVPKYCDKEHCGQFKYGDATGYVY